MRRRDFLAGTAALAAPALARAQSKPEKLVFVGDNGPWHWCLVEEVAPAFEKATGIKVDFTLLPIDALSARLKGELNSGSLDIDIIQWTAPFAGWLAPGDRCAVRRYAIDRHIRFCCVVSRGRCTAKF